MTPSNGVHSIQGLRYSNKNNMLTFKVSLLFLHKGSEFQLAEHKSNCFGAVFFSINDNENEIFR